MGHGYIKLHADSKKQDTLNKWIPKSYLYYRGLIPCEIIRTNKDTYTVLFHGAGIMEEFNERRLILRNSQWEISKSSLTITKKRKKSNINS